MASGGGDEHHAAAVRFIRDNNLPRPASQLARHVEVKVALSMWGRGLRDETVVMDRPVCGTREFDRDDPFTCDKYLARLLPPGARHRNGAAMTLSASVPTFRDGVQGGRRLPLDTDADVQRLAELLAEPWADSASIQTADTALEVHIRDNWGYMLYAGDAGYLITDGDPASPDAPCEANFPAGTGLPAAQVVAAVREFVRTRKLPETVPWRDA